MRLSKDKINSIQQIMKDRFGKVLSDEEAQDVGMAVLQFVIAKSMGDPEAIKLLGED